MLKLNRVLQGDAKPIGPKNANRQYFNGEPLEQLDKIVRESIQNPLDNPIDSDVPVKVVFKNRFINVNEIPEREELIKTIEALIEELEKQKKSKDGQINDFIKSLTKGKILLSKKNIGVLQISDYNTTGLTGSIKDTQTILGRFLGSVGYFDDSGGGGGSGGLGKFAPFLASMINFCFYSSFNIDNEFLYYGWGDYFTHEINGKKYRPEINIGTKNSDVFKSKKKPNLIKGFLAEREELGSDVFALGFEKPIFSKNKWVEDVSKATIRNYFGSIIENKLEVEIHDSNGDKILLKRSTINDYLKLFDKNQKVIRGSKLMPDALVLEAIDAFQNGKVYEENISGLGLCSFRIIVDSENEFSRYITYMRKPRMLIEWEKKNLGDIPFSAVFCTLSDASNEILRNTEDSHHTKWNYENLHNGRDIKKELKKFIENCIKDSCTSSVSDEFEISGTTLLTFGTNKKGKSANSSEVTKEATPNLFPINNSIEKTPTPKFSGTYIVGGDTLKKPEPKKPKYVKRGIPGNSKRKTEEKREYRVADFKPSLFKNDSNSNEYYFFINSDKKTNIRRICFSLNRAEDVLFISQILDKNGKSLSKDTSSNNGPNTFENFELEKGQNKFVIKTKFDKKFEILIN